MATPTVAHRPAGRDGTAGEGAAVTASAFAAAAWGSDTSTLGEHLRLCQVGAGRLFGLARGAEALHRFAVSRFVTTLALAVLLIGIGLAAA